MTSTLELASLFLLIFLSVGVFLRQMMMLEMARSRRLIPTLLHAP